MEKKKQDCRSKPVRIKRIAPPAKRYSLFPKCQFSHCVFSVAPRSVQNGGDPPSVEVSLSMDEGSEVQMDGPERTCDGKYKCSYCNYANKGMARLIEHIRIHTGKPLFHLQSLMIVPYQKDNSLVNVMFKVRCNYKSILLL